MLRATRAASCTLSSTGVEEEGNSGGRGEILSYSLLSALVSTRFGGCLSLKRKPLSNDGI